jgi:hypothetical protein
MSKKNRNKHQRTEAQINASRINGALSKGPVTPEGRAKIATNNLNHGFYTANPVLQGESQELYDRLVHGLHAEWFPNPAAPANITETGVIHDLADARWRLNRIINMANTLHDLELEKVEPAVHHLIEVPDQSVYNVAAWDSLHTHDNLALEKLHLQEVRLHRIINRSMKQLAEFRDYREKQEALARQRAAEERQNAAPAPSPEPPAPPQPARNQQDGPSEPKMKVNPTPELVSTPKLPVPASEPENADLPGLPKAA